MWCPTPRSSTVAGPAASSAHAVAAHGQTRLDEQRDRQRKFKGVVLPVPVENDRTDPLDVLSVTTTMEVGVDIGSLRSVTMASVHRQAVRLPAACRARGRSGQPFSFAITVCRDRSHDDYYFNNVRRHQRHRRRPHRSSISGEARSSSVWSRRKCSTRLR